MSYVSRIETKNYSNSKQLEIIEPAVSYLKEHIFDCGFKINMLHTLCEISNTYFRNIFISCYGVSPKKYVFNKRMTRARQILISGEYAHIYSVALSVGYSDSLYFSKIFKEYYEVSPTEI